MPKVTHLGKKVEHKPEHRFPDSGSGPTRELSEINQRRGKSRRKLNCFVFVFVLYLTEDVKQL